MARSSLKEAVEVPAQVATSEGIVVSEMGPTEINGLPAHALLVHAVVVLVPLAALVVSLSALWPRLRWKLSWISPLLALVALISVPLTTNAGEWLAGRVSMTPMIAAHTELGDTLFPWVIGLFLVSLLVWGWGYAISAVTDKSDNAAESDEDRGVSNALERTSLLPDGNKTLRRSATVVVAVLALTVSVGSVVQVYRIGESGARAVWSGVLTQ